MRRPGARPPASDRRRPDAGGRAGADGAAAGVAGRRAGGPQATGRDAGPPGVLRPFPGRRRVDRGRLRGGRTHPRWTGDSGLKRPVAAETDPSDGARQASGDGSPATLRPGDPLQIRRFGVIRLLGQGGLGRVYLAHDDELDRLVAIKVPNPERIAGPEDVEAYLAEARALATPRPPAHRPGLRRGPHRRRPLLRRLQVR